MAASAGHWSKGKFVEAKGKAKAIPTNAFEGGNKVTFGNRTASIWALSKFGGYGIHTGTTGSAFQEMTGTATTWQKAVALARKYLLGGKLK